MRQIISQIAKMSERGIGMNKNIKYEDPECKVIYLSADDIITTSGDRYELEEDV